MMNLSIKPIEQRERAVRRPDSPAIWNKVERCEIHRNAPAHAVCHRTPEFRVIFFNGASDPEMDLCLEHTLEVTRTVCDTMGREPKPSKGLIMVDKHNHAVCSCGVVGFEATFTRTQAEVLSLKCVACGAQYDVTEEERHPWPKP